MSSEEGAPPSLPGQMAGDGSPATDGVPAASTVNKSGGFDGTGRPALMVHGGAGGAGKRDERVRGVVAARDAGWRVLADGGSAVDAVEIATRVMEADPYFNAGYGSTLTREGTVEVDAMIMDGATLDFGAIAVVKNVRYASTLARRVMESTPHSFLAGPAAEDFAQASGLAVTVDELVDPEALRRWRLKYSMGAEPTAGGLRRPVGIVPATRPSVTPANPPALDTVGAVALDGHGHVAAVTSTGGVAGKWSGRIGDSPIPGAGAYADDRSGAVSCTGEGEHIMRVCLAHAVCGLIAAGAPARDAARLGLAVLMERTPGLAGLIAVDAFGRLGWAFNTPAMPVAWRVGTAEGSGFDYH